MDNEEFSEIYEDIKDECMKYGRVMSIQIPKEGLGAGHVFIEFYTVEEAKEVRRVIIFLNLIL